MQEQTIEKSDERIGVQCNVAIHKSKDNTYIKANLYDKKFANLKKNDIVYVLTPIEHQTIMNNQKQMDEYIARINKLELEINESNIKTLTNDNEDLKKQLKNKEKSINTYKTNKVKSDARIEDLEKQLEKQSKINDNNETIITNLKSRIDSLGKELDANNQQNIPSSSEDEIAQLKQDLESSEDMMQYWKNAYENLMESSDELSARNESLIKDNNQLKDANNKINETNMLLNENIMALKTNFDETKQELQSSFENKEKELKETIKKQQSHIDELTDKYQSLLVLKDNIPQSEHYKEIDKLKDELRNAHKIIDTNKSDLSKELAKQKQELNDEHHNHIQKIMNEKSDLEKTHTNEKAQMLVAYNQELNHYKMQYNELAMEYNHLLHDANSLSRINTLFNGKHKSIVKDKEPVELEVIEKEKDKETIEYVPKDEITLI